MLYYNVPESGVEIPSGGGGGGVSYDGYFLEQYIRPLSDLLTSLNL